MTRGYALSAFVPLAVIAVFLFAQPYPQPQSYYAFADDRTRSGVPNFWNVTSNALFLLPGIAGLWLREPESADPG